MCDMCVIAGIVRRNRNDQDTPAETEAAVFRESQEQERDMLKEMLDNVRKTSPLIQNITNYVTANDCANITLAWGASPIMSDCEEETEDMAGICMGLNINMGTLNSRTAGTMLAAGKAYNVRKKTVILDPVGVGASRYRKALARDLMEKVKFTAVKGNISEVRTLITGTSGSRGVDADLGEAVTEENLEQYIPLAKKFAEDTGAVVVITGAIDLVADASRAFVIRNGHSAMSRITGCGCMLSSILTACMAANPAKPLEAAAASVAAMGLCGERACRRMEREHAGNASCRTWMIDEIYNLTGEELEKGADYELY